MSFCKLLSLNRYLSKCYETLFIVNRNADCLMSVQENSGHSGTDSKIATMSSSASSECVRELDGDLFAAPKDHSLAHCVASDLKMGAGIAVRFKQLFKGVDELRAQSVGIGGVAVLNDGGRFVYYLITKAGSYDKPTYGDLTRSLEAMRKHMLENGAKKLAIPRIGCGIDGLEWPKVKGILNTIFGTGDGFEVVVYNFVPKK